MRFKMEKHEDNLDKLLNTLEAAKKNTVNHGRSGLGRITAGHFLSGRPG